MPEESGAVTQQDKEAADHKARQLEEAVALLEANRLEEAIAALRLVVSNQPQEAIAWANMGVAYGRLQKFEDAVTSLEKAAALDTNSPEILSNLGSAYYQTGRFEKAARSYRRAAQAGEKNAPAYFGLGNSLCELERYEEAQAAFESAILADARMAHAHYRLGVLHCHFNRFADGVRSLRRAAELAPTDNDILFHLAQGLAEIGDHERALEIYGQVGASENYTEAEINLSKAMAMAAAGRYEEALPIYRSVLSLVPQSLDACLGLARTLVALKEFGEAEEMIKAARRLDPESVEAIIVTGEARAYAGRNEEAAELFRQAATHAAATSRQRGNAYYNLSGLQMKLNRHEEAIAAALRARLEGQQLPERAAKLAAAYFSAGRYKDAATLYEETRSLNPRWPHVDLNLGLSYYHAGDRARARASWERAVARHQCPHSQTYLAELYFQTKEDDLAVESLRSAIRNAPAMVEPVMRLACYYQEQERAMEAIPLFAKAALLAPDNHGIFNNLAMALMTSGLYKEAAPVFERLLELQPEAHSARVDLAVCLSAAGIEPERIEALKAELREQSTEHAERLDERLRAQQAVELKPE